MSTAGKKIIDGLKDAIAGNFAAVTIEGQHWVRREWQPIETLPETPEPPEGRTWPAGARYLLYSPNFGIRIGETWNWRGHKRVNVSNLHGCAIEDWGATHWMPLPDPPSASVGRG